MRCYLAKGLLTFVFVIVAYLLSNNPLF